MSGWKEYENVHEHWGNSVSRSTCLSWCWESDVQSSGLSSSSAASSVCPVLRWYHPLSLSSKRTLSHLSVLTSAVCPVLPDSLWLHLKTLYSAVLKPITALSAHSHVDRTTHGSTNIAGQIQEDTNTPKCIIWWHKMLGVKYYFTSVCVWKVLS